MQIDHPNAKQIVRFGSPMLEFDFVRKNKTIGWIKKEFVVVTAPMKLRTSGDCPYWREI
jgi:hypothetical protein